MTHIWHKVLAKRDIGNIWDRRSNGTYNFVHLVSMVMESVVDGKLIDQGGVWNSSSEVRCENWVQNGKVIKMSGFGVVLLSVWTWWGAWVQGNVYCWGWMICCRKRWKSGAWCSGNKINLLSGAYTLGRIILGLFRVPWILTFEVVLVEKNRTNYFDFICGRTGSWMGGEEALGAYTEGGWLSAVPWLVMLGSAVPCWPVSFICARRCSWYNACVLAVSSSQKNFRGSIIRIELL